MSDWQVRDPVHGFIRFDKDLVKVVNSSPLQRLRNIRQLALASLAYPGALHTRFDHSLGVAYIAGRMCDLFPDHLQCNKKHIQLAALLHDIGHGPFSHVSEEVFERVNTENVPDDIDIKEIHEFITRDLIFLSPEIPITSSDRNLLVKLLAGDDASQLDHSILSGSIDADKQDYLLRDSYFCGVSYGVFDLEHLHSILTIVEDAEDKYLAVEKKGIPTLEQYFLAKHYLQTQVYRHKVRNITDQMLVRCLELAVTDDHLGYFMDMFQYPFSGEGQTKKDYFKEFQNFHDNRVIHELTQVHPNTKAGGLFGKLYERKLLKRVLFKSTKEFSANFRDSIQDSISRMRREIEFSICGHIKNVTEDDLPQSEQVIIYFNRFKSRKEEARNDGRPILIPNKDKEPLKFEEESMIYRHMNADPIDNVECYAPIQERFWESKANRKRLENSIFELLTDLFQENLNQGSNNTGE